MNASETKRVAVYCRVSTASELQDTSFETQRDAYIDLIAARPDLLLVDIYGDHGKSGRSIKLRPEFQRMIKDCDEGKIDIVMTKSISRFARNLADCISVIQHLKALKIPVLFEREGIDTMDKRSEMLLHVLATIAQEESISIGQNMRWANERRHAVGEYANKPSYGYEKDKTTKEWRIVEAEARRVRFAFEKAYAGWRYCDIRDGLNQMEKDEGSAYTWLQMRLHYLLTNVSYKGDVLTGKSFSTKHGRVKNCGQRDQYYLAGHHQALVSNEVFDRVQGLIAERKLI